MLRTYQIDADHIRYPVEAILNHTVICAGNKRYRIKDIEMLYGNEPFHDNDDNYIEMVCNDGIYNVTCLVFQQYCFALCGITDTRTKVETKATDVTKLLIGDGFTYTGNIKLNSRGKKKMEKHYNEFKRVMQCIDEKENIRFEMYERQFGIYIEHTEELDKYNIYEGECIHVERDGYNGRRFTVHNGSPNLVKVFDAIDNHKRGINHQFVKYGHADHHCCDLCQTNKHDAKHYMPYCFDHDCYPTVGQCKTCEGGCCKACSEKDACARCTRYYDGSDTCDSGCSTSSSDSDYGSGNDSD